MKGGITLSKVSDSKVKAVVWLPVEVNAALKNEATEKGLAQSALLRTILIEHVKKAKGKTNA